MVKERAAAGRVTDLGIRGVLAFAAIYLLWGGTFLAIRVAVLEVPPFMTAGLRFLIAGALLYVFSRLRGQAAPSPIQWVSIAVLALSMFAATYGALFWAEQYLPSGITSVLEATQPVVIIALEVFVLRSQPLRWRMLGAVMLGLAGVALLLFKQGPQRVPLLPSAILLCGSIAWSVGAVLTRVLPLPRALTLTAGAQMMLGGLVLLVLAQATGEFATPPHVTLHAFLAFLYLIVGGSIVAFTAYVWLLSRMPATRVASHAYVNPVVAVALGYFLAGEMLTTRMIIASTLVIASVFLILREPPTAAPRRLRDQAPAPAGGRDEAQRACG